jgi:hypothetical protein
MMSRFAVCILLFLFLVSCVPNVPSVVPNIEEPLPASTPLPTVTMTPSPRALWVSPVVPAALRSVAVSWEIPLAMANDLAALRLDLAADAEASDALWIYALVAPFPTLVDGVSGNELRQAWAGKPPAAFSESPLLMDDSTLRVLTAQWGQPAPGSVRTVPEEDLLSTAWAEPSSWAVIPFESIVPEWKVLTIDEQSPIRKDFNPATYPLKAGFDLTCATPCPFSSLPTLPSSNRDASKLTTLVMTGVTAMVRSTAYIMENKGVKYPGHLIGDWLRLADVAHISNEVSFFPQCPYPNPGQRSLIFCSRQSYMDLLLDVGADVIELTGDHLIDYGHAAMLESLEFYRQNGLAYYGGGANLQEAQQPLLLEHNGNKIAFIGCNAKGDKYYPKASELLPGPAPCDFDYMDAEIQRLRQEGYLVIATFSWYESYDIYPNPFQVRDFRRLAESGALIVNGSQAHRPQTMEFYRGAFIHYGLGNLFFDQMYYNRPDGVVLDKEVRSEFLDRHVFYDGRYLGVELLTAMLEDYATPRPMEAGERFDFLREIFTASGWESAAAAPTFTPTVTSTPLLLDVPVFTPVP